MLVLLSHVFIDVYDEATLNARSEHKALKKQRNTVGEKLHFYVDQFNSGNISQQEFNETTIPLSTQHKELIAETNQKYAVLNKAKDEAKVFGFNNLNVFVFQFGAFLILLLLSFDFYLRNRSIEFKKELILHKRKSLVYFTISFYYLVWIFYPYSDLPRYLHLSAIFLIGMVLSIAVMSLVDWKVERKSIVETYKLNFQSLFYFIVNKAPAFVDETKMNEYTEGYLEEVEKFKIPGDE